MAPPADPGSAPCRRSGWWSCDVADDAHHPGLLVVDVVAVGHPLPGITGVEVAGDGLAGEGR